MPAKTGKFPVPCTHCGKQLERYPYQLKARDHHFCDKGCMAAYFKTLVGPAAPCYKRVTATCPVCGKDFVRVPHELHNSIQSFCGLECYIAHKASSTVTVPCDACGKPLPRQQNQLRKLKHHFCDMQCEAEWLSVTMAADNNHNWKGGAATYYGPNWPAQARAARRRDGYCCQSCGIHQTGKALDVHHIMPFKSFGYIYGGNDNYLQANQLNNLVSLCQTCHRLIEAGRLELLRSTP